MSVPPGWWRSVLPESARGADRGPGRAVPGCAAPRHGACAVDTAAPGRGFGPFGRTILACA
ncbi:hypothetical protein [Allonocardiopsis opalescens]|uniref:hypothetical protein n=1 Tax=Allonocardiopsis opalescens TaxID=1144618 RepID=UPI0011B220C0|nr:hypothetical protein [Allonocardiopsis opalescens]